MKLRFFRTLPAFARQPALLALALVIVGASRTSGARAQPMGKTVVVAIGIGDLGPSTELADDLEGELLKERVSLISLHDARGRFTARSRPPQSPSAQDVDALAHEAHDVVEHVAFGRTAAAQRSVRTIITLAERTLESLNRETPMARTLLDACLALVRSSLQANQRETAIDQAMRCRRLVPDLAPSEVAHPANVVGVLAEADDRLRRMNTGNLRVNSASGPTCAVYLNGRHLGTTPFALDRAPVGEYRVQVECHTTQPGRVHVVQLGDAPVTLVVDESFDDTVVAEGRLGLRFQSEALLRAQLVKHAILLGKDVQAEDMILGYVRPGHVELLRVQVPHQRLVGAAVVPLGVDGKLAPGSLQTALAALTQGRFVGLSEADFRSAPQTASVATNVVGVGGPVPTVAQGATTARNSETLDPTHTTTPRPQPKAKRALQWAGGAVLTVGLGGEMASWLLYGSRVAKGHDLEQALPDGRASLRAAWDDARRPMLAVGVSSSLLAVAGVELLLLSAPNERLPWWVAGTGAALGAGLAAWGIVHVVEGGPCTSLDVHRCVNDAHTRDRGSLLLAASAPLLSIPITKLIRGSQSEHTGTTAIGLSPSFSSLTIHGRW